MGILNDNVGMTQLFGFDDFGTFVANFVVKIHALFRKFIKTEKKSLQTFVFPFWMFAVKLVCINVFPI